MTDPPTGARPAPTWSTVPEVWAVVRYRPHLLRTTVTAVIVGTILFAINQLDVVLAGVLVGCRRPPQGDDSGAFGR